MVLAGVLPDVSIPAPLHDPRLVCGLAVGVWIPELESRRSARRRVQFDYVPAATTTTTTTTATMHHHHHRHHGAVGLLLCGWSRAPEEPCVELNSAIAVVLKKCYTAHLLI